MCLTYVPLSVCVHVELDVHLCFVPAVCDYVIVCDDCAIVSDACVEWE